MPKLRTLEHGSPEDRRVVFFCPGCHCGHQVPMAGGWQFNGDFDKPTFSPSILIQSGHYAGASATGSCWCTYNAAHPDEPSHFKCGVCHSFVREGRIEFLGDCTHELAGQTVELPDITEWRNEN